MHVQQMIRTHPQAASRAGDALVRSIEHCFVCAQSCTACADACLGEEAVAELRRCIRLNLDCADLCLATGNIASRQTAGEAAVLREALEACAAACELCGDECASHAEMHEHCRVCAEACRSCERACREAASSVH